MGKRSAILINQMQASVQYLAIGDELLAGEVQEGNGYALASYLSGRGLRLAGVRFVSDDLDAIIRNLHDLVTEKALVITSGGLGPTDDDRTRAAVAAAAGVALRCDGAIVAALEKRYEERGMAFPRANVRQAMFPVGADVLANPLGTAPGFALPIGDSVVACFPGVPRELAVMIEEHVPALLARLGIAPKDAEERTFRIFGIAESALQDLLSGLPGHADIAIRSLPSFPEIRLELRAIHGGADLDGFSAAVRRELGWRVFAESRSESFPASVVAALRRHGRSLATAESCTGGLLGHLITQAPGASAAYIGGVVAYADAVKKEMLGVPSTVLDAHGAVSEQVARAMAVEVRARFGTDLGLATTGIAGPTGAVAGKPVGTVHIALSTPEGVVHEHQLFSGFDRRMFKRLVAYRALSRVRCWLDFPAG
ncbi:MAG: CinA family nicotinamide mononucleotide deamidase-related protein [Candidatus Schekmanbacteria bacterium]|nr:CinA family nicotinamide mononucleotide deamidase-related protein [Candidatus Schekmanbacteria bacterium]